LELGAFDVGFQDLFFAIVTLNEAWKFMIRDNLFAASLNAAYDDHPLICIWFNGNVLNQIT
jgi:hypothetical protein